MLLQKNKCFSVLPGFIRSLVRKNCSLLELGKGTNLSELATVPTLYFPVNCVVVMTATSAQQRGSFLRFGGSGVVLQVHPGKALPELDLTVTVCGGGYAFAVPADVLWSHLASPHELTTAKLKLLYSITQHALMSARCASSHTTSQRLARILLEVAQEFGSDQSIPLTQEEFARLLSVRRETVTQLFSEWSASHIVETARSRIVLRNRAKLEAQSCACFSIAATLNNDDFALWSEIQWKNASDIGSLSEPTVMTEGPTPTVDRTARADRLPSLRKG